MHGSSKNKTKHQEALLVTKGVKQDIRTFDDQTSCLWNFFQELDITKIIHPLRKLKENVINNYN
uniref:Uncharacterized protein n=1 Tax=Arion vulgaris TaxID=1028688 RepID=A0A0B7ARL2_9EUPU